MSIVSQKDLDSSLALLGITADQNWQDVQSQYRLLVQKWHPDRHSGENGELAQTRFIELNTAFKTIRDYYRKTGALPMQTTVDLSDHLLGVKPVPAQGKSLWAQQWFKPVIAGSGLLIIAILLMSSLDSRLKAKNEGRAEMEKVLSKQNDTLKAAEEIKSVTQTTLLVP